MLEYRLAERDDTTSPLLFEYLRRAFDQDKTFANDRKGLKAAIRAGACTVSELRVVPRSRRAESSRASRVT